MVLRMAGLGEETQAGVEVRVAVPVVQLNQLEKEELRLQEGQEVFIQAGLLGKQVVFIFLLFLFFSSLFCFFLWLCFTSYLSI